MPSGAQAAREAADAESERRARRQNTMPEFFMENNGFALIKPLATGAADDRHFGFAQVHLSKRQADQGNVWYPCPTSYDDPQGKCYCPPEEMQPGCEPAKRAGIFVWVYGKFRTALPEPRPAQGGQPARVYNWPQLRMSDALLQLQHGLGQQHRDPFGGIRYWQQINQPMVWFRGPDYNDAFIKNFYERLTYEANANNLTSHPVLISKKAGKTQASGFGSTDWEYEIADPAYNRHAANWPEIAYAVDTPEVVEQQRAYFKALPDMREYFLQQMRWPLFDQQGQAAPVPQRQAPPPMAPPQISDEAIRAAVAAMSPEQLAAVQRAADTLPAPQSSGMVEAPDPQNPTPPPGDPAVRGNLGKFLD